MQNEQLSNKGKVTARKVTELSQLRFSKLSRCAVFKQPLDNPAAIDMRG